MCFSDVVFPTLPGAKHAGWTDDRVLFPTIILYENSFVPQLFHYLCFMVPTLHIAIPVLREYVNIQAAVQLFLQQDYPLCKLYFCVNQPDSWHNNVLHKDDVHDNLLTLQYLHSLNHDNITILDRTSPGKGWGHKKQGVGMARKALMDYIATNANPKDIIISMDADTLYPKGYYSAVAERFLQYPKAVALAIPYHHPLPTGEQEARAMLRYEIYMRYYALQMWQHNLPYAFTALGSAIALPVAAYTRVGGITPHAGGEDFYLLQKLAKTGNVLTWCREKVQPSARISNRVPIGTGPAMARGLDGDWTGYPFYPAALFDEVAATFRLFPALYGGDVATPMTEFLQQQMKTHELWAPLRKNFKTCDHFVRACIQKVDGLRIRQYLRWRYSSSDGDDLAVLNTFLQQNYLTFVPKTGFSNTDIALLEEIRNSMEADELALRKAYDKNLAL